MILAAICLTFSLVACSGSNAVYESVEEFERHVIPEEYDSEYSTTTEVFTLKEDTDYPLTVDAKCESGTVIGRLLANKNKLAFSVCFLLFVVAEPVAILFRYPKLQLVP